jgi:NAD-dependent SIR2 family protein deacetylase
MVFQLIMPFKLTENWKLITRTTVPVAFTDLSIFRKNRPNFWTFYLWQRVLTDLNHQTFTHWGLRPKTG